MPDKRVMTSKLPGGSGAADLETQLADYYRWIETDRGITIYINFETVERLQLEVLSRVGSSHPAGGEVGGILLGTTGVGQARMNAVIEGFVPIPRTSSNGPLYHLGPADQANFEAIIRRYNSDASAGSSVIGFYRSHHRESLCLSADDLSLIQSVFRDPGNVFLLIKPRPVRGCTAGFFFWDEGSIQSDVTLEVPFGPIRSRRPVESARPGQDPSHELLTVPAATHIAEDPTPLRSVPRLVWERKRPRRNVGAGAVVAAAVVLLLGTFGYWEWSRQQTPTASQQTTNSQRSSAEPLVPQPAGTLPSHPTGTSLATPANATAKVPATPAPPRQTALERPKNQRPAPKAFISPKPRLLQASETFEQQPAIPIDGKIGAPILTAPAINPPPPPQFAVAPDASGESLPAQPKSDDFASPEIIRRANPAVPAAARSLISAGTQVEVTVAIDVEGNVVSAQVTSVEGAVAVLVAPEAIKAAKLFRFRPARRNGRAVPSTMVLRFRFKQLG